MDPHKIELFFATQASKFQPEHLPIIRNYLEKMDDDKFFRLQTMQFKDPTLLLVLSILVGHFGVDRFLLDQTGVGIAKLLTCGGLGIWTLVDWFLIMGLTREYNFNKFMQVAV
ncbi:MAG: TM2 domain-containing protein [Bacteroidales bacterium]|nr:TM2 domain-containing protein [Bacteroidales bacterium]